MKRYSIELRTIEYVKGYGFFSFTKEISNKYGKKLATATQAGAVRLKTAFKKAAHKAVEAKNEFIGNKIAEKIFKPKPVSDANFRNIEKITK